MVLYYAKDLLTILKEKKEETVQETRNLYLLYEETRYKKDKGKDEPSDSM